MKISCWCDVSSMATLLPYAKIMEFWDCKSWFWQCNMWKLLRYSYLFVMGQRKSQFIAEWLQHTGTLDRISFQPLSIHTQGCHGCQKKQNCKGFTKSLVWCTVFHSKLRKVKKTSKRHKKWLFFKTFFDFSPFWLKKQHTKPKILESPCNSTSFDTHNILRHRWIVEISSILRDFREFSNGGATWWVFCHVQN